ncbi:DNA topoisomerase III, partial [Butyricicoccus sp. 1XD8-22]
LYLKKLVSYPRTGSRYVSEAEIPLMHKSFDILSMAYPDLAKNADKRYVSVENKRICNPEKIEDHYAILMEPVIPKQLTKDEQNIYSIVLERFFMQFQPPMTYKQKDIVTEIEGHTFKSRYKQMINLGWKSIIAKDDEDSKKDTDVHDLQGYPLVIQGPSMCENVDLQEKETSPPSAYNDGTLMAMMDNISNKIDDPELKEKLKDCGIGTSATRAATIKKLVDFNYLAYEKKALTIT